MMAGNFIKGDIPNGEQSTNDTARWRNVLLPHDWSIEGPFQRCMGKRQRYLPGGIGWYKKTFDAPASWQSKKYSSISMVCIRTARFG
jgi:hypothetical protein